MISTPFILLKSKKFSSQKETFIKEIQVFAENLIKEKKKFEGNASKEHSQFSLASKEKKELMPKKVLNFISKLSLKERMKLFTISNKWLVEVLIQLFSLYQDNNRIAFGLKDEMAPFICDENKCWKCGHEFHGDEYDSISYYSKNSLDSKFIPFFDECGHDKLNYNNLNDYFDDNKSNETDIFSYKLYFKICDTSEEKEDKNQIQMESDILKYIKIIKQYDIITLDKELLLDLKKLEKFFEYFTKNNYFKDWIIPIKSQQGKNFNLPKWIHKIDSFTFFQILITFLEQHILLNYEYYFYTNRIYQTKYQEKIEELYDEIILKASQINSETFSIDKIYSENIIKDHANKLYPNNNFNNDELTTNIYNELKNDIKKYNDLKEKVIKLLERLTFLDLDEVINKRQLIYESYKNFILETLENEIDDELIDDFSQKKKKHKENKKLKNKNIIQIGFDKNEIKENNKEENKEIEEENQNVINEETENNYIKDENENKICLNKNKEKSKEFSLFTNFNNSKKNNPAITKEKEANLIEKNNINSDDKLIRILRKDFISSHKSLNNQDENEDCSPIINDMRDNAIQDKNIALKSPPKKNIQNSINDNTIQNFFINFNKNNTEYNSKFLLNISRYYYNKVYNTFYDKGIDTFCKITKYNVLILNKIKCKYLRIIIKDIIKKNLKEKYDLIFNFYGSSCTNLSIEGSDTDCCIFFKALIQNKKNNLSFREELFSLLEENEQKREDISYKLTKIFDTKIPRIVVTIDIRNDLKKYPLNNAYKYLNYDDMRYIKLDFTFTQEKEYLMNLNKSVQYVKNKIEEFPQLRPVFLVLKRFFKNMGMNEVYTGGISPYSLFLLALNSIYNYQKESPGLKIKNSQFLVQIFRKFSYFKFDQYRIGQDNNEYILDHKNEDEKLYILDPLTGKNVASVGKCTGKDVKSTFIIGYNELCFQNNYFKKDTLFPLGYNPIESIVSLFKFFLF